MGSNKAILNLENLEILNLESYLHNGIYYTGKTYLYWIGSYEQ